MDEKHKSVNGYRELNQTEIDDIAKIKKLGDFIETVVDQLPDDVDKHWIAIGKTHLQQGLMAITRAIAKPDLY